MLKKIKITLDAVYIILLLCIGFFIFNKEIFNSGTIGIRSDWPIPPLKEQIEAQVKGDTMYAWNSNGFGYERNRQAGNYIDFINLFIANTFNVGGEVISKYPLIFFILSSITCYVVLRKMEISEFFAFWGGYFYAYNVPFLTNSLLNGYLKFVVSYALLPIFIYLLIKIFNTKKINYANVISLSLVFALVSGVLNFFFIGLLVAVIIFLFEAARLKFELRVLLNKGIELGIMVLSAVLVQATAFFIPIYDLFSTRSQTLINSLDSGLITFLTFSHPLSFPTFRLFSTVDNLFERTFYQFGFSTKLIAGYLIFLFFFVFINFFIEKKNRYTQLLLLICITSLFILKGINEPFGYINKLFYKIPLMAVLRNISYITLISGFAYAYLLANGGEYIYKVIQKLGFRKLSLVVYPLMFITLLGSYPLISHKVLGVFDQYTVSSSIKNMYTKMANMEGEFNTINFPPLSPFIYVDEENKKYVGPGFNPFINNSAKPAIFSSVTIGYSHDKHAYLYNSLLHSQFGLNTTMLNLLNIGLLTFDRHFESIYPAFIIYSDNNWFKSFLLSRNIINGIYNSNLELVEDFATGETLLFKPASFVDSKVTVVKDLALDVGDNDNIVARSRLFNTDTQNSSALMHSVESDNYKDYLYNNIKFVHFGDSDVLDLAFNIIDRKYSYEPGNFMERNRNDARKEWTPIYHGQFWWYDVLLNQKDNVMLYLGKEAERSFDFKVNLTEGSDYEVYVRAFTSVNGSDIRFEHNSNYLGEVFTKSDTSRGFKYLRVGSFTAKNENTLRFLSSNGVNAVADVIVAPKDEVQKSIDKANGVIASKPLLLTYDAQTDDGIGADSFENNIYYSREYISGNKSNVKVTVPKAGNYNLQILTSKEKTTVSESVTAEYFKIVNHNHEVKQELIAKNKVSDAELCVAFSYIDRKTFKPSFNPPNAPLLVTLTNLSKGATKVVETSIYPTRLYGYGDMMFECIKFNGSDIDVNNKLEVTLYSYANKDNIVWAIPYANTPGLSKNETMRHQLRGYNNITNNFATIKFDSQSTSKSFAFNKNSAKVDFGTYDFKSQDYTFDIQCGVDCKIDNIVLSQVADVATQNNILTYVENTPSKYTFEDTKLNLGDILVFKEGYSDFWQYPSTNHFVVNGVFNGWLIDDTAKESNEIYFKKQIIYDIAGLVSNMVLIALIGSQLYLFFRNKYETTRDA